MNNEKKIVGYVQNCHIDMKYLGNSAGGPDGTGALFQSIIDPESGIEYCVAFLDNMKIEKLTDENKIH